MSPLKSRFPSLITAVILWFLALMFLTGSQAAAQTLPSGGRLWTAIKEQSFCPGEPNRFSFVSVTDASTGTRIARWGFLDSQGNTVRVIGGLAFDNTRRAIWYTSLIRSCTGPTQGDGLIYRRPARGFTVTSIPDPGGPGGPGIGAMDYDAEEDVLWVAAFRPVNGQSVFYKINPAKRQRA